MNFRVRRRSNLAWNSLVKALVSYSLAQLMTEAPQTPLKSDSGRADAKRTVRVVMQEYMRRDSLLPVLRLLFDLTFLGAAIVGA